MGMFTPKIVKIGETGSIGRQLQTVVTVNGVKTSFSYEGATTRHHPVLIDASIEDKVVKASISVDVTELDKKYNDGPYPGTMDINVDPAAAATQDYATPLVVPIQEVGAIGKNKDKKATLSFYFESAITCKKGTNNRTTSDEGIAFITTIEGGIKHKAYPDAGHMSIGVGHQIQKGEEYLLTATITDAEALMLLTKDLAKAEKAVNSHVSVCLKQNQFDALVSFTFNVGTGSNGFSGSTLLKKINANASEADIRAEFARWNMSQGKVNPVLVARRQAEADLYFQK
jgi:lysozyme